MKAFLGELRRRHVYRVTVVYVVMCWLVLQVADVVLGIFETPAWVMKALLALMVLGFPLAVMLAWAFELTPDGLRRTEPLDSPEVRAPEDRRRVGRGLNIALGSALLAALVVIGWQHASRPAAGDALSDAQATIADSVQTKPRDERKSIAVVPLANSSGDAAQDYFSDGLSDELIAGLSRIDGLRVIGRSSSFQFKGTSTPGTEIASKLGVEHLLEGSVRQQAERVRIMVALVRAEDGSALWAQTFDRDLDDIFTVQREIAQAVASSLRVELTLDTTTGFGHAPPPSGNPRAYQAFLQGRTHGWRGNAAGDRAALDYHREAIRLDPNYLAPYVGMTLALYNLSLEVPMAEAGPLRQQAREAAAHVQRLAPDSFEARYVAAQLLAIDKDPRGAEQAWRRALESAPNHPSILTNLGMTLTQLGRFEEAVAVMRRAIELDPLSTLLRYNMIWPLLCLGELDAAEREVRAVIAMDPEFSFIHGTLGDIHAMRGDVEAVRQTRRDAASGDSRRYLTGLEAVLAGDASGVTDASDRLIAECEFAELNCTYAASGLLAFAGQADAYFASLERMSRDPRYFPFIGDPHALKYWQDPRFLAHLEKYGLSLPSPVTQSSSVAH